MNNIYISSIYFKLILIILVLVFTSDEEPVKCLIENRLRADDFEMVKTIGRGAFGEVQLVSDQFK